MIEKEKNNETTINNCSSVYGAWRESSRNNLVANTNTTTTTDTITYSTYYSIPNMY